MSEPSRRVSAPVVEAVPDSVGPRCRPRHPSLLALLDDGGCGQQLRVGESGELILERLALDSPRSDTEPEATPSILARGLAPGPCTPLVLCSFAGVSTVVGPLLLIQLRGHDGEVRSAAFSPDGTRIVTASEDGTARIWESLLLHDLVDRARAKVAQAQALSPAQECEFFLRSEGC